MTERTDEINYNDFKTICRTCLFNCDLQPIQQNNIITEVLYKFIGDLETNEELPQQICFNCFEKINEIHEFASRCRQTQSHLMKCLNNFKNKATENEIKAELIQIKQEVLDEDEIGFEEVKIDPDPLQQLNEDVEKSNTSGIKTESPEENKPIKQSVRKIHMCDICNKTFKYSSTFKRHKNVHSVKVIHKCDICSKEFKTSGHLLEHRKTHSRNYKCDVCDKTFKNSSNLADHKQTHKIERPFKCNVCLKAFKRRRHLESHERIHSDDRPVQCDLCNKRFKFASNLAAHLKTHSSELPFKCDVCFKGFKFLFNIKRHMRIHSGERPYKCDVCDKTFADSSAMRNHKLALH